MPLHTGRADSPGHAYLGWLAFFLLYRVLEVCGLAVFLVAAMLVSPQRLIAPSPSERSAEATRSIAIPVQKSPKIFLVNQSFSLSNTYLFIRNSSTITACKDESLTPSRLVHSTKPVKVSSLGAFVLPC